MNISRRVKRAIQQSLRRRGFDLHRITDEERKALERHASDNHESAQAIFGPRLERLQDLRRRYAAVRLPLTMHSMWASRGEFGKSIDIGWTGVDLPRFRGSSAYVWDYGTLSNEINELKYYLFTQSVRQRDHLRLLDRLSEDGAFGCSTFEFKDVGSVSRDLLDSVGEINFLDRNLHIMQRDDLRVLDIGAGYGRTAHRMLEAHPGIESYTCVDAVPESTFLCEFYLEHRGLSQRAEVIPLDELDARLQHERGYNLAMNIHSFSECTYDAIEWWLRRIHRLGVRHLLIVPNDPTRFLSLEPDRSHRDYAPLLKQLGYQLIAQEPVFEDPQVQALIGVRDNRFLFELV